MHASSVRTTVVTALTWFAGLNFHVEAADDGLDCASVVPYTDCHPIRSPQVLRLARLSPPLHHLSHLHGAQCGLTRCIPPVSYLQVVHSSISRHLIGKSLVEIGTRNGDGMACFARVTLSAVAVEMNPTYCKKLEMRSQSVVSQSGAGAFSVRCTRYQDVAVDADVFTWWQQYPHLKNEAVLTHLRKQLDAGSIRQSAMAIILFEVGYSDDIRSWQRLRGIAAWNETVEFDETTLCKAQIEKRKHWLCSRAHGTFHVAGIRIADVDASKIILGSSLRGAGASGPPRSKISSKRENISTWLATTEPNKTFATYRE
jgi:hypothetical protein